MTDRQRLPIDVRKSQILSDAFRYACKVGYDNLTRDGVAGFANVSTGQVTRIFGNINNLRAEVIGYAVREAEGGNHDKPVLAIVARGILDNDEQARAAEPSVKQAAMQSMGE